MQSCPVVLFSLLYTRERCHIKTAAAFVGLENVLLDRTRRKVFWLLKIIAFVLLTLLECNWLKACVLGSHHLTFCLLYSLRWLCIHSKMNQLILFSVDCEWGCEGIYLYLVALFTEIKWVCFRKSCIFGSDVKNMHYVIYIPATWSS